MTSTEPAATADTLVASDTLVATQQPVVATDLDAGARIGRYFVISKLGAGAMGVVFAAYDPKLDRKVALKLLARTEATSVVGARERLQREALALAKLAHPNVVGVFDVDVHGAQVFVVMEHITGRTVGAWMRERPRPWQEVLRVFIDRRASRGDPQLVGGSPGRGPSEPHRPLQ